MDWNIFEMVGQILEHEVADGQNPQQWYSSCCFSQAGRKATSSGERRWTWITKWGHLTWKAPRASKMETILFALLIENEDRGIRQPCLNEIFKCLIALLAKARKLSEYVGIKKPFTAFLTAEGWSEGSLRVHDFF